MRIFHYHPETGRYLGESDAEPCPVSGAPLIPAWATATAPPAVGEKQYAAWDNNGWVIKDAPQPEPEHEPTTEDLWTALRAERNTRLSACDWTQLPDAPLVTAQKTEWQVYRQELRDLPANTTDPANPTWPEPPA